MHLIIIHKILNTLILLAGIAIFNFFLFHLSPGDPTNLYFGPQNKKSNIETLRKQRGYAQPWYKQFQAWLKQIFRGNLGYSWSKHRPVLEMLKQALPATLQLTILAILVNVFLGCIAGLLSAIYADRWQGKFIDFTSLTLYSMPTFWLALLLIYLFSLKLQWLPASQMSSFYVPNAGLWASFVDRIQHLVLPLTVLGLTGAAATSRYVCAHAQDILNKDYIRSALAKGLSKNRVYWHHALKNAIIPVITLLGLYWPFLLGGAFIVEVIFAWPGMGRVTYEAVFSKDYPLMMATNLIAAVMVITGNLISDLLYRIVDPRIQLH